MAIPVPTRVSMLGDTEEALISSFFPADFLGIGMLFRRARPCTKNLPLPSKAVSAQSRAETAR